MSTDLVPRTRTVIGYPHELTNIVAGHVKRGTLVSHTKPVPVHRKGTFKLTLVYRPLPAPAPVVVRVRLRARLLRRVWPAGEGKLARVARVAAYVLLAAGAVGVGFVAVWFVEWVIEVVRWVHHYWRAILVVLGILLGCGFVLLAKDGKAGECD